MIVGGRRVAAPAPERERRRRSDRLESEVDTMCREWAAWSATRHRFGAPRLNPGSSMEQFHRVPSSAGDQRSGYCSRDLAVFNWAVINHEDQDGRAIFEAHFLRRDAHIKRIAMELGIARATWYRRVNAFARSVYGRFEMVSNCVSDTRDIFALNNETPAREN